MPHPLWTIQAWKTATEEEVIVALFDPPPFLDPEDMGQIKRYHPTAKAKYLNLFYEGKIPQSIKKLHKL